MFPGRASSNVYEEVNGAAPPAYDNITQGEKAAAALYDNVGYDLKAG